MLVLMMAVARGVLVSRHSRLMSMPIPVLGMGQPRGLILMGMLVVGMAAHGFSLPAHNNLYITGVLPECQEAASRLQRRPGTRLRENGARESSALPPAALAFGALP